MRRLTNKITPLFSAAVFAVAHAAEAPDVKLTEEKLVEILCKATNWMFSGLMGISIIMVLVGAFFYVTAAGDSEKVSKGTKTITYAAAGIVVALLAKGVPLLVGSILGITVTGGCAAG